MYLAYYSKEHENLSLIELYHLFGENSVTQIKQGIVLLENIKLSDPKRLSYTKKITQILFEATKIDEIIKQIKETEVVFECYKDNFAFRKIVESNIHQSSTKKERTNEKYNELSEKEFADFVGTRINEIAKSKNCDIKLKVKLENSQTLFELIFINNKIYFCKSIYSNENDHQLRSPDKRESFYPISLKPRLAKALVNIGAGFEKYTVIDPFCGTGGFLIESCLMSLKSIGNDLDKRMVESTKVNIKQACDCEIQLYNLDAIHFLQKIDSKSADYCIVCDPPYSKNTKKVNFTKLYEDFISCIDELNVKRVVFMLPLFRGYDHEHRHEVLTLYDSWFSKLNNYSHQMIEEVYVHNTLSRLVWLVKRK